MNKLQIDEFPLVTLITPSYNQGRFIKQTIDSVLNQSYEPIEYWIIDGGSTDETLDILKSYGSKIKYVSEKDNGQTHAINKGLQLAKGEIFGYLNSDDYLFPDAIHLVIEAFKRTDRLWVTGDYQVVDENGNSIHQGIVLYKKFLRLFSSLRLLKITNYIVQPSTFYHHELVEKIGLFDESLHYVMDYDYWLRAYPFSPPQIIWKQLSAFRIHKFSKGGNRFENQFTEEYDVVRKYTKNPILRVFHSLHNKLIILIYRILKTYTND